MFQGFLSFLRACLRDSYSYPVSRQDKVVDHFESSGSFPFGLLKEPRVAPATVEGIHYLISLPVPIIFL
jgi:hypothetical protein